MIKAIYRERRYSKNGEWFSWFESCAILSQSPKRVRVQSQDFPGSPLYPGGVFSLDLGKLLGAGKCYSSRHGEWFHLGKPRMGELFPSQEVMQAPSFVMAEAIALGWATDKPIHQWEGWQKRAWLLATLGKQPLAPIAKALLRGGEAEFQRRMAELKAKADARFEALLGLGRGEG